MSSLRHFVTVWNPAYATNAIEEHLRLLLDWDTRADVSEVDPAEVYVWWGKVRSSQRQQPMPHLDEIVALGAAHAKRGDDDATEMHLYLTDYRSLYVAEVGFVTTEDPRWNDAAHVPPYYQANRLHCDCWFMLRDVRALVRNDLEGVAAELAQLRNTRYHDRPVSLYGGMVDLPLIVTRTDERSFFAEAERALLADSRLWARFDAEQGGAPAMAATLRDDHFGTRAWQALDIAARQFITTAEQHFRDHRHDPGADLSPTLVSLGKAIECQLNQVLQAAMRTAPDAARRVKVGDVTRLLPEALPLTLGMLARAIGGERALAEHLAHTLEEGRWLVNEGAAILDAFADARNPAAHGQVIARDTVRHWRDQLMGVGCAGFLVQLARVRPTTRA